VFCQPADGFRVDQVDFIGYGQDRDMVEVKLSQDILNRFYLFANLTAAVDNVEEKVGFMELFQGCTKGIKQILGQLFDKTDGVGDDDFLFLRQPQAPRGWIKGGKRQVFGENFTAGHSVEQG